MDKEKGLSTSDVAGSSLMTPPCSSGIGERSCLGFMLSFLDGPWDPFVLL